VIAVCCCRCHFGCTKYRRVFLIDRRGINKQLVSFRNNTATTPTISTLKYHWDFNGKDSSHSRNTSYVFDVDTSQWVYITLTVMDSIKGCTSKYKDSVYVRCIHADFNSSDNRAACPELQCYFYDQSSKDSIVSGNGILVILKAKQYFGTEKSFPQLCLCRNL
jgi:hypothetical protein